VPEHDMVTAQNTENSAFYCFHACDTYPPSRDYAASSDASNSPSQINIEGAKLAMPKAARGLGLVDFVLILGSFPAIDN